MSPAVRPNFYELLELPPTEDDWEAIEQCIEKKRREWARDAGTGIPAKARKAKNNMELAGDIRVTLRDPTSRRSEAKAYRAILDRQRTDSVSELARSIEVLAASRRVDRRHVDELAKRFQGTFERQEIEDRLRKRGVKVNSKKRRRERERKTIPDAQRKEIRSSLEMVGKSSLYDFLGLAPQSSPKTLRDHANQRNKELLQIGQTTAEANAERALCGLAMAQFQNDETKSRYDGTLASEAMEQMKGAIETAGKVDRLIDLQEMDLLIRQARAAGVAPAVARDYIEEYAHGRGWDIQDVEETEAEKLLVCGYCNTLATDAKLERCGECGELLHVECPVCEKPAPTQNPACVHCGCRTGDAPVVRALMADGRRLMKRGRLGEAKQQFENALVYWPGWKKAERELAEVKSRQTDRDKERKLLNKALGAGRLFEARGRISTLERKFGRAGLESIRKRIDQGIQAAEKAFRQAQGERRKGNEQEAFRKLQEALAAARDHPRTRDLLRSMPPPPPRRLTVEPLSSGFRLSWFKVRAPGTLGYRVLRKEGGAPTSEEDGEVLGEVAALTFDDVGVPTGKPWFYAVFSRREGVSSTAAAADGPYLRMAEVEDLELVPGPGEVSLRWKAPAGCRKVLVVRKEGTAPASADDGVPVPASRRGAHDTGLVNGRSYGYLVAAVFADPLRNGRETLTKGLRRTASPVEPPPAVIDLVCRREGRSVSLSWTPVGEATVQIRSRQEPLDLPAGRWESVEGLDRLGKAVASSTSGKADLVLERQGRFYFVPLSLRGAIAVVGKTASVTTVDDVRALQCRVTGDRVVLTWEWPEGGEEVRVAYRHDREPTGPEDPAARRVKVRRAEYDRNSYWELRGAERRPHYFKVFSRAPNADAYSAGASAFESFGKNRIVRFQAVLKGAGLGRLRLGPVRSADLELRSSDVEELRDLLVVVRRDHVPRSPKDGEVIKRVRRLRFDEGRATIPLPSGALGSRRFANLFFGSDAARADVRLMPAGKQRVELG